MELLLIIIVLLLFANFTVGVLNYLELSKSPYRPSVFKFSKKTRQRFTRKNKNG